MIRSIIVDDEPIARRIIKNFLKDEDDFLIIGECDNGTDALKMIIDKKPDLVFLDIQMPEMDGFDVINALGTDNLPFIIFVTAYDQYAIKAFEINALDYLLKPFDMERFKTALDRAKELITSQHTLNIKIEKLLLDLKQEQKYIKRILLKSRGRVYFLKTEDIQYIEAADYYAKLHTGKDVHLIREGLSSLENKLDPAMFARIHRSYIVNIEYIKELQPWSKDKYLVILKNGAELNLSKSYRSKLFSIFGKF